MLLSHYHRVRLLLLTGIILCAAVFWFMSRFLSVPAYPGLDASVLDDPSPILSLAAIAATLLVCVLLGTAIAGTIRFDAGLFCAVVGMGVLSLRGGRMGDVLREMAPAVSPRVLHWLAIELALLYGMVGLAWAALWLLHRQGWLKADEFRDGVEDTDESLLMKISALAMQAGVMALCMLVLMQSDAKNQSLAGVFVSALAGAWAAHFVCPVSPSVWLWAGPCIVGIVGYLLAYFNPEGWQIGQLTSNLSGLARATPLDYATAGPAGAILGYWMSRRWYREHATEAAQGTQPA